MRYFIQIVTMLVPILVIGCYLYIAPLIHPFLALVFGLFVLYDIVKGEMFIAWYPKNIKEFMKNYKEIFG